MKLIPNWKKAWRFFSIQAQALALAGVGAWQVLPDDLRAAVPVPVALGLAMAVLVLGIVGRLIAQPEKGSP